MTLDQLMVLKSVVEMGSFRAASEKLNRAQSAVSYAIKKLEQELGVTIFDRQAYRPQLTSEGQVIVDRARRILFEMRELETLGQCLKGGNEPLLTLAVTALFPLEPLADRLDQFSRLHPETRLDFSLEVLGALPRLEDDQVDFVITELINPVQPGIILHPLCPIRMLPVCGKAHSFAHHRGAIPQSLVTQSTQIVLKSTVSKTKDVRAGIIDGTPIWRVTDFYTKKILLLRGVGWGFMPEHLVEQEIISGQLVPLEVDDLPILTLNFYLAKKRERILGPRGKILWQMLTSLENLN